MSLTATSTGRLYLINIQLHSKQHPLHLNFLDPLVAIITDNDINFITTVNNQLSVFIAPGFQISQFSDCTYLPKTSRNFIVQELRKW